MRITLDRERCTGHGRCYMLAPEVFDADDEGYGAVRVDDGDVPPGLEAAARKAAANCPEEAITTGD
ncbi:MAG TPA: ferredoxin [Acidimicrobiales bacterium]|nr:ferredoxin [Acidimicrobiales bacterium]